MTAVIEFFQTMICPGMLPFTVLLGFMLGYWAIVAVGAVDIDCLDSGLDVLADGAVEGGADGVADAVADGPLAGMLSFINIGKVPATIVLSFVVTKMWFFGMVYYLFFPDFLTRFLPDPLVWAGIFVASALSSLYLTALSTRPLRGAFEMTPVTAAASLVGQLCTVTSSKVTASFGTAEMATEGASFLLNITCDIDNTITAGQRAVIVDYDKETSVYAVRPMDELPIESQ